MLTFILTKSFLNYISSEHKSEQSYISIICMFSEEQGILYMSF